MNLDSTILYEILSSKSPGGLKALDPSLHLKKKSVAFLDESYHSLDLLEKIDPSHLDIIYDSYPKKDISLIQNNLKKGLNEKLNHFIKKDCLEKLLKQTPCLPYKYTPLFSGSYILFLNSSLTKQLIMLLGLYDLKLALKTLIDQGIINQVHTYLTDLQKMFLKELAKEADKVAFKRLPLETWDKQKTSFEGLIYLRGLNRFSKAYHDVNPFIKNELILRLAYKDKAQFITLCTKVEPQIKEALISEIEHAFNFMKKNLNFNF